MARMAINKLTQEDLSLFKYQMQMSGNAFDLYQKIATKSAIYPGIGTPMGLAYVALKGSGEAGEFAEHVGKAMRDDDLITLDMDSGFEGYQIAFNDLTPERKDLLIKEIGDQLWYLAAKCNELGTTLSQAAVTNIEKLADRSARNALQGEGDTR